LAGLEFEAAAQGHLAGAVAFDEERAHAEGARDFVADDDAAERRRNHPRDLEIAKKFCEGTAQRVGMLRMREDQRALDVGGAVASAGQLEMALADRAYLFEHFEDVVTFHGASRRRTNGKVCAADGGSLKAQAGSVNVKVVRGTSPTPVCPKNRDKRQEPLITLVITCAPQVVGKEMVRMKKKQKLPTDLIGISG